jgi:hypothetical protein
MGSDAEAERAQTLTRAPAPNWKPEEACFVAASQWSRCGPVPRCFAPSTHLLWAHSTSKQILAHQSIRSAFTVGSRCTVADLATSARPMERSDMRR